MTYIRRPFSDIAERLVWHRLGVVGLTQMKYAEQLNISRPEWNSWEKGHDRLTLDAALVLNTRYGLSLDFLYLGISDALPMTLRNAWLDYMANPEPMRRQWQNRL